MSALSLPRLATPPIPINNREGEKKALKSPPSYKLPQIDGLSMSSMNGIVEIEWILSVVWEAYEKMLLVSQLHPELLNANVELDEEVNTEQKLNDFFNSFQSLKEAYEGEGFISEEADYEAKLKELRFAVEMQTSIVARLMMDAKDNQPQLVKASKKMRCHVPGAMRDFVKTLEKLHELMKHKLNMTTEEELTMHGQLEELIIQEREDTEKFNIMKKQLDAGREEHTAIISDMDRKINRLNKQIGELKSKSASKLERNMQKWQREEDRRQEEFSKVLKSKKETLDKLRNQLEGQSETSFREELKQHSRKYKKEEALENLMNEYDGDITDLHSQYVELNATHEEELDELKNLREKLAEKEEQEKATEAEMKLHAKVCNTKISTQRIQRDAAQLLHQMFKVWWIKNNKPAGSKGKKGAGKKKK